MASFAAAGYGFKMIIVTWDGKNLPAELRNLPPGTYAIEPTDAPALSAEDEEGLRRALRSIEEGRTVAADEARRRVRAAARR